MAETKPDLPPHLLNEIITRIDALEKEAATSKAFRGALIGAFRAFFVVFGIRWLPDRTGETNEADSTEVPPRRQTQ